MVKVLNLWICPGNGFSCSSNDFREKSNDFDEKLILCFQILNVSKALSGTVAFIDLSLFLS